MVESIVLLNNQEVPSGLIGSGHGGPCRSLSRRSFLVVTLSAKLQNCSQFVRDLSSQLNCCSRVCHSPILLRYARHSSVDNRSGYAEHYPRHFRSIHILGTPF